MKVTQEKRPNSQIALSIEVPAEATKKAYEKVVRDLSKNLRIPGFRKGKVPRQVLLQRVGPERIRAESLETLVQDSINQATKQEEVDTLGNYQLEPQIDELLKGYQPGKILNFAVTMDVSPTVQLGDYQSLVIKAEESSYDPQQVEDYLAGQQSRLATLVPVEERPAQRGDVVVLNYTGRLVSDSGEPGDIIEGAEATDFELELESGKFLEDLIQGIEGMAIAETKEIPVQFPEDYAREDLAGQSANFTVTIGEIKEKELPELDDDFAEEISEFETLAELRTDIEQKYQTQAKDTTNAAIENAIAKQILTVVDVEIPETLIDRESNLMIQQTLAELERYGLDPSQIDKEAAQKIKAEARPEAIERIKTDLALKEVAKQQSIEPDAEQLAERTAKIYEQLSDQKLDPERVKQFVSDELLEEQSLAWLRENLTIELVPEGSLEEAESTESGENSTDQVIDVAATDVEATASETPETESDEE
ncbi:MAG: trigger factor [Spirulina sp. SIO3F2]|nr:trigger factor [Spirulina sp. SIO3F2]